MNQIYKRILIDLGINSPCYEKFQLPVANMFLLALVFGAALINQGATQTCKYKEETDKSRPESSSL